MERVAGEGNRLRLTFHSKASESARYRPDIDGLRAIAVLAVVFYHAGIRGFPGGYVGVDIFFVISGYLITRVLEDEMTGGRFTFAGFYERRIRRIFPALFAVVLTCSALVLILFPPPRIVDYGRSLLAMSGFVSNVYFKSTSHGAGYFAEAWETHLLLHTWSLSVEEQFYVFFPILLLLLHRYGRRHKDKVLLALLAGSFAISFREVHTSQIAAFYLLPGRAWELLAGAVIACKPLPAIRSGVLRTVLGAGGLAAIVYAIATFTDTTVFPGANALYPCVGAALLLYAGEDGGSWVKSAMGFPPLVFVGAISYSLYLWHWPLLALNKYFYATAWATPRRAIPPLVLSLVLAVVSFEFVETPFRRRHAGSSRRKAVWVGIAANAAVGLFALCMMHSTRVFQFVAPERTALLMENHALKADNTRMPESCNNWGTRLAEYKDADFCEIGHGSKNVLMWGDSHAGQMYQAMKDLQEEGALGSEGVVFAMAGGCPPAEGLNSTLPGYHCDKFTKYAMQRAAMADIDTVFLEFSPQWVKLDDMACVAQAGVCTQTLSGKEAGRRFLAELAGHLDDLKRQGRRTIVGLPYPVYDKMIPDYEIRRITMGRLGSRGGVPYDETPFAFREELREVAVQAGAAIFDPRETLCPDGRCVVDAGGVSLYSDYSHLAGSRVYIMEPQLKRVLAEAGVGR